MPISGRQLLRLLELDGWTLRGRRTHGVMVYKQFPGESHRRSTVIPDKTGYLPPTTLGAILSVKQTRLGHEGLQELIDKHGMP